MQAMFVAALGALHNFIRIHDPSEDFFLNQRSQSQVLSHTDQNHISQEHHTITEEQMGNSITIQERNKASNWRDCIAKEMWQDYQAELQYKVELNK